MSDRELLESMSLRMAELVRHVAKVRKTNTSIEKQVALLREDVDELKDDVKVLRRDVDVLKGDVKVLRHDVNVLKGDVKVLRHDVNVLKDDVKVLRQDVNVLQNDMRETRVSIRSLDAELDDKTTFLSGKIDHFVTFVGNEIFSDRTRAEEQYYHNVAERQKNELRFQSLESRLDQLEARHTPVTA